MKLPNFRKKRNQMTKSNEIKYTLKELQSVLINVYHFNQSLQTLRNHIKKLDMPMQAPGKAIPTYSDNDVKKLANHFNLKKQEFDFEKLGKEEVEAVQQGLNDDIQRIHVHEFRQRKTDLKIDWLFDNAANYNVKQPQFNDDQLLEDLKKLDEFETFFDITDIGQQSQRIELIHQIDDYSNYISYK